MQPCMVSLALKNSRYLVCDPKFHKCHLHLSLLWLKLANTLWFHSPSSLNSFCQALSQIASSIAVHICFWCMGRPPIHSGARYHIVFFLSNTQESRVLLY
ncbi:hypothetical protein SORBI_3002G334800 [Sorghum bicolor]|uniref:Uncharacterized protein n=1 Tax=Sorghum bicolor TaxID=4558 RepID=A0A1B6QEX3_SORBI|nr:hypothetical protein SORBI_3002G334800 [Sorghum bicolor]